MPKKKKNPFIVIEALDAGGSSTQTSALVRKLKKEKYNTLQLHFPQEDRGTGSIIYDKFLRNKNKRPFSRREQALLYIQDLFSRKEDIEQHLSQKRKAVVVTDRFVTSTMAYQTMGLSGKVKQAMYDWIYWLSYKDTPKLPKPDLVIYLDTPVEVSLEHLKSRKQDYFENRQKQTAVRNSYLDVAKKQKWTMINSVDDEGKQRSKQDIHKEIWTHVEKLLAA